MAMAGNKAKQLLLVNHTTKTSHQKFIAAMVIKESFHVII